MIDIYNKTFLKNTLVATFLVATFVGCGGSNSNSNDEASENNDTTIKTYDWKPAGGNATVEYDVDEAFLKISNTVAGNELTSISQGRELFIAQWQVSPSSRALLDGLGPLFNANACTTCHVSNGRVAPFNDDGTLDNSFLFRISNAEGQTHPTYGGQFQTQASVGPAETAITWEVSNDIKNVRFISSTDISSEGFNMGGRISPHLVGPGLLDIISEDTILEYEDENDANNDGISGRAHWVTEENELKIGRFGWKAINSSLRTQNAGALHQDMGLTSPVNPSENCTSLQEICLNEENGGSPEVSDLSLESIVNFMTALGVPERRIENQDDFNEGSEIFERIDCASCHRPTMVTGTSTRFEKLNNQTIYPYTDLLLHDMGESLSDGVIEKDASGSEWRTPPLWGIGIVEEKEGAKFLHDGRASSIKEAIQLHDGEAKNARDEFEKLNDEEVEKLLTFLRGI